MQRWCVDVSITAQMTDRVNHELFYSQANSEIWLHWKLLAVLEVVKKVSVLSCACWHMQFCYQFYWNFYKLKQFGKPSHFKHRLLVILPDKYIVYSIFIFISYIHLSHCLDTFILVKTWSSYNSVITGILEIHFRWTNKFKENQTQKVQIDRIGQRLLNILSVFWGVLFILHCMGQLPHIITICAHLLCNSTVFNILTHESNIT